MKVWCGVDPGLKGGIAILKNKEVHTFPMPLDIHKELNTEQLARIMFLNDEEEITIIVEDVHSIFGASAKSNFKFGWICGQINSLVYSGFADNVIYVQPKVWQKEIWINEDIVGSPTKRIYKKSGLPIMKIDTKKTSYNAVKRIFPNVNIPMTPKSKVPHDGICDSLLIAEYGRRMNK